MDKLQFARALNLGIIYKEPTSFWNVPHLLNRLTKYSPHVNVSLFNVANQISPLPTNLNAIVMIPSEAQHVSTFLSANKDLKWIHSMFSGVDKFVTQSCIKDDSTITLTNSRGAFAESLSEFVILSMLYFNYNIPTYFNSHLAHQWVHPLNTMITGKTITLVGYGKNGANIAKKAKLSHNMKVIAVKRNVSSIEGGEYLDTVITPDQLDGVLGQTDFLVNLLPETRESVNFFNMKVLSQLKSTAVFVNIGRGSAVVEEDLIECLKKDLIKGAVLDVTKEEPLKSDSPLYDVSPTKLLLSCHTADNTDEYFTQAIDVLEKNIELYLKDEPLYSVVDKEKGY